MPDTKDEETLELENIDEQDAESTNQEDEEKPEEHKEGEGEEKAGIEEEDIDPDKIEIETRNKHTEDKPDYGEDIDPDDIKTIGTIVEKQTAGVKKALQEQQDRLEVESFIQERPEFAKYKPAILKYLQHPVYNQIPVKNIAAMVASNDLIKLGAQKEREAQARADATKTTGSAVRKPSGGTTDWSKVSKDEFEAQKRRVLGQGL